MYLYSLNPAVNMKNYAQNKTDIIWILQCEQSLSFTWYFSRNKTGKFYQSYRLEFVQKSFRENWVIIWKQAGTIYLKNLNEWKWAGFRACFGRDKVVRTDISLAVWYKGSRVQLSSNSGSYNLERDYPISPSLLSTLRQQWRQNGHEHFTQTETKK